jgi:exosome complex RNA-binding protein Rrp42 (RNase PH superfamily)
MNALLSLAERDFIQTGVESGLRQDGRAEIDFRTLIIENSVLPQVNGSSRVRLGLGTELLCSVKLEITEPEDDAPDRGILEVGMEISPSCARYGDDPKKLGNVTAELSEFLRSMYIESASVDLEALCIISGTFCWTIFVDVVVMQVDCNILDACSIAMYVALDCTRVPALKLIPGERGEMEDFEVMGDLTRAGELSVVALPLLITVHRVGGRRLLDADADEISCASGAMSIAVDSAGTCRAVHKQQVGTVALADIRTAVSMASTAAAALFPVLSNLKRESARVARDGIYEEMPPIRQGFLF